mgnify:CR=1 FL=1
MWNQRDPAMKMDYSGPPTGVGAAWAWTSKSEGDGKMTFTAAERATLATMEARGFSVETCADVCGTTPNGINVADLRGRQDLVGRCGGTG